MRSRLIRIMGAFAIALMALSLPAQAEVTTAWIKTYDGDLDPPRFNCANELAMDNQGNVYVTGFAQTHDIDYDYDVITIKYLPDGSVGWTAIYDGPSNISEMGNNLVVTADGEVYVAGQVYDFNDGSDHGNDFLIIKYLPNGDTAWARQYNGDNNTHDYLNDLKVTAAGDVYAVAYCDTLYLTTLKYSSSGDLLWMRKYRPAEGKAFGGSVEIDDFGNVFACGGEYLPAGPYYNPGVILVYSSTGDTLGIQTYEIPGTLSVSFGQSVLKNGYLYVAGTCYRQDTDVDFYLMKTALNGDTVWNRAYDGGSQVSLQRSDWFRFLFVDDEGNAFITGDSYGKGHDFATVKYSPDGDLLWASRYDYKGFDDEPRSMAVDVSGSIYLSGYSERAYGKGDFFTVKLNADGTAAWARRYSPGDYYNCGNDVGVDGSGNVYAAGYSHSTYDGKYLTVIKYSPSETILGDADSDGNINLADVVFIIGYIFRGGPAPDPLDSADANCDSDVNLADAMFLINYIFNGGNPPNCM